MNPFTPISYLHTRITDSFWSERQQTNASISLFKEHDHCEKTGHFDALLLQWKPGRGNPPHVFWDSDVAKWIEAVSYVCGTTHDPALRRELDRVVTLLVNAQQKDGYINSHFITVRPDKRWHNLRDDHELYTAGHIFEAGVAYWEATGNDLLLKAACRFADYIHSIFGSEEGKMHAYCGHEEIELALVRLYKATGIRRYLDLSAYFVNQRGQQPFWFLEEHKGRQSEYTPHYYQAHLPVREQTEPVGHAVRAVYLYSAMADLARELPDASLWDASRTLWTHLVDHKLYITGGIGSSWHGEAFSVDYDLPNERAYCETCASVGLIMWAHRMAQYDPDTRYADIIERVLHNSALSGLSLDGKRFFYQNPLASRGTHHRQEWFDCACCPANISRLIASLGGYIYSHAQSTLLVHQYIGSEVRFQLGNGASGTLRQKGGYPWDGHIQISIEVENPSPWELRLRIPSWAGTPSLCLNGREESPSIQQGYICIDRLWKTGDTIALHLPMSILRIESHPAVFSNAGQIALTRGPFVYCMEDADFETGVASISLPADQVLTSRLDSQLFPIPLTVIEGHCLAHEAPAAPMLYQSPRRTAHRVPFRAIPYFAWDNRSPGAMRVWVPQ